LTILLYCVPSATGVLIRTDNITIATITTCTTTTTVAPPSPPPSLQGKANAMPSLLFISLLLLIILLVVLLHFLTMGLFQQLRRTRAS
jgi:hypothetical protein